ncbi:MAG: DUF1214 domain-containing protein [Gammaproteobacteria bacterium]|nr:DUF1214 domain-containing protein [Gammaproteobacteria bacterium]
MTELRDYEVRLKSAWEDFCDELKAMGNEMLREQAPSNPTERAAAFRLLSRNIALALSFELENKDPEYPELNHYFDPLRKQGGDNTDALYVGAQINGTDTYKVSGHRGSASFFAVTVVEQGDTPWGGGVAGTLFGKDLQLDENGYFELMLSPEPQPGNWIKTTPQTFRVTFRQFFSDWENEEPMRARIDRLSGDGSPPSITPEKVARGFERSAAWLRESICYWADMIEMWKARPNTFLSYRQLDDNAIDATPGGEPLICYWQLPAEEALIIRVTPPAAEYWAVEFGNYWWESMDYRYHLSNTNDHYAQLEEDGELILVVSHADPGLPNWLDPSGHSEGYVTFRWIGSQSYPSPQCEQVKADKLFAHLPARVQRISAVQRAEQLVGRRRGVAKRFPY